MTSAAGQMGITPIRVALVYDFDGTLAPRNLPEHSFLPSVGVTDVEGFWEACRREAERHDSDQVLTYMRMLLTAAERAETAVTRDLLRRHGALTPLFAGVEAWFDDINAYGRSVGVEIEHFVVSSGLLEMIEGLSIHPRFRKVRRQSTTRRRRSISSGSTRGSTTSGTTRRSTSGCRSRSGVCPSSRWCSSETAIPTSRR